MDVVTRQKMNVLIQLAKADHDFADVEREKIILMARDRNFSQETLVELMEKPESVSSLGALSIPQKLDYLMSAMEVMFADGKILSSEVMYAKNLALKLGFRTHVVDFLVENFKKWLPDDIRSHVLKEYSLT